MHFIPSFCDDAQPPSRRSSSPGLHKTPATAVGKVHSYALPVVYDLARLVEHISNPHPSWTLETPPCSWDGVTCDPPTGAVTELRWMDRGLRARNFSLQHLPRTLHLVDLSGNSLWGTVLLNALPDTLRELVMDRNLLHGEIDLCDIPEALERLSLAHNQFQGSVELASLPPHLRILCLNENAFEGEIDLGKLPNTLEGMDLSENQFHGTCVLDMFPPSLKSLRLSKNKLSGNLCLKPFRADSRI